MSRLVAMHAHIGINVPWSSLIFYSREMKQVVATAFQFLMTLAVDITNGHACMAQ